MASYEERCAHNVPSPRKLACVCDLISDVQDLITCVCVCVLFFFLAGCVLADVCVCDVVWPSTYAHMTNFEKKRLYHTRGHQ